MKRYLTGIIKDNDGYLPRVAIKIKGGGNVGITDVSKEFVMKIILAGIQNMEYLINGLSFYERVAHACVQSNPQEQFRDIPPTYLYNPVNGIYNFALKHLY